MNMSTSSSFRKGNHQKTWSNTAAIDQSFYVKNRVPAGVVTTALTLSDPDGLSVGQSKSTSVPRDPLVFDLNMDGKVEIKCRPIIVWMIYNVAY